MEGLRQYIISVVTAAIICGIITGLAPKGTVREMVKMLCGLFLALTVIRPIARIDDFDLSDFGLSYGLDAKAAAVMGEDFSREAMADIIKAETEAYILDKAAELNVTMEADVTLSQEDIPVPVAVHLSGDISPYAKQQMERFLTEDLGIAKENQLWTG